MKLLVDNQLPLALARFLASLGEDCCHVLDIGLDQAADRMLWQWAADSRAAVISKDEDFFQLATRPGASVQVVWVRLGNCRTGQLLAVFARLWPQIMERLDQGDQIIEVR